MPLRPRNSVRSPRYGARRIVHIEECGAVGEFRVVWVAREERAAFGSISVITCMLDFGRRSPSTHSTYPVAESRRDRPDSLRTFKHRELDRRVKGHVNPHLGADAVLRCARIHCSRSRAV